MRRILGLSQRVFEIPETGEKRDCLAHDWSVFLAALGVRWLALPNSPEQAAALADELDLCGIVLTGGDDIGVFPERDRTETVLLEWCARKSRPVMGICRGFQVLHCHFGGKLMPVAVDCHCARRHMVDMVDGNEREVNSYHRFSPDFTSLPSGYPLREIARCRIDGVVEAAGGDGGLLGLMWHPEREVSPDSNDIKWFTRHFDL